MPHCLSSPLCDTAALLSPLRCCAELQPCHAALFSSELSLASLCCTLRHHVRAAAAVVGAWIALPWRGSACAPEQLAQCLGVQCHPLGVLTRLSTCCIPPCLHICRPVCCGAWWRPRPRGTPAASPRRLLSPAAPAPAMSASHPAAGAWRLSRRGSWQMMLSRVAPPSGCGLLLPDGPLLMPGGPFRHRMVGRSVHSSRSAPRRVS